MPDAFHSFTEGLHSRFGATTPKREQLQVIAQELLDLCTEVQLDQSKYRPANPGEEVLYELATNSLGGPALYLVSDGVGVSSPPHEHQTWAVIVGIRGEELNVLYKASDVGERRVSKVAEYCVGPEEVLIMEPHEIHSTDVRGSYSTYHVHLYGRSLASLSSWESRCYVPDDSA